MLVGTNIPFGEPPGGNAHDRVVWREEASGAELARSSLLPAVGTGTMVEPGYAGRMYYLGQTDKIIKLEVHPR